MDIFPEGQRELPDPPDYDYEMINSPTFTYTPTPYFETEPEEEIYASVDTTMNRTPTMKGRISPSGSDATGMDDEYYSNVDDDEEKYDDIDTIQIKKQEYARKIGYDVPQINKPQINNLPPKKFATVKRTTNNAMINSRKVLSNMLKKQELDSEFETYENVATTKSTQNLTIPRGKLK